MSVKDVIKSSVYERFAGGTELSFWSVSLILVMALLVGFYIYLVYKNFCKSEFYSKDLNITIAGMAVVVAAIMIAMQSNLLVSLGMVGALSIVRFRTAVKNPMDLLYLFWSISAGIICGVGLYVLGIVLCIIMTVLIAVLGIIPNSKAPALLVIHSDMNTEIDQINHALRAESKYLKQKSIIVKNNDKEWIFEVSSKKPDAIIQALQSVQGVRSINWLEHSGEFRG